MMNNETCKKPGVKCLIPLAVAFAVLFVFQWLFHGVYMMPAYEATASLWRSKEEMEGMMWVCILTKLIMAFAICCLYCWMAKNCESQGRCVPKGAHFGFNIGLLLGAHDFASYMWLPIEMDMAVNWFVGDVIMGILIGVALAYTCRFGGKAEGKAA